MNEISKNWMFNKMADWIISRAIKTPYDQISDYMERYWLGRIGRWGNHKPYGYIGLRIHHIKRSDHDGAFHDHPFHWCSLILKGGYTEVTPIYDKSGLYLGERRQYYGPGSIRFGRASAWHRLEVDPGKSAWTLFIVGPRVQSWGFLVEPQGKMYYRNYLENHTQ